MNNKKKILFIHHGQVLGGAPTSLKNTIIGLQQLGFSQLKVVCAYPDMKSFFENEARVAVGDIYSPHMSVGRVLIGLAKIHNWLTFVRFFLELIKAPLSVYRQIRTLHSEAPDIVHLNSSILVIAAISTKLAGYPLVWHVREVCLGGKYNVRRRFTGWLIRSLADQVICISEVEARSLGKDTRNNVNVIYNFIDFSTFKSSPALENEIKLTFRLKDKPTYLSLGGTSFRKGTVEIIQAARLMPDAQFVIAGVTPKVQKKATGWRAMFIGTLHRLEDKLKQAGLKKYYSWYYEQRVAQMVENNRCPNVFFVGRIDFVPPLIALSDAVIFAGCTPHFPRPVYEAWALEKPVVVFDMEGVSDNIDNSIDGVICDSNDATGLVRAFGRLDARMGAKGRHKAMALFDMQRNILQIADVYGGSLRVHLS